MMLVRTPRPVATESLLGYVLRVSEANGYDTPWHILKLANIGPDEMDTAAFPVGKFANVLGLQPEELNCIAYSTQNARGQREYKLLNHSLGYGLNTAPLRLYKPRLCPACIVEHGYIDAFFDLKLAVACPEHRRALVSHCPACGMSISLFRPGILTCRCGASLTEATPPVSPAVAALMAILKSKVHEASLPAYSSEVDLPVEHLLALPLRAMLINLPKLSRFNRPDAGKNMTEVVEGIAEALADWPRGFHRFLKEFAKTADCTSYQKRFRHLSQLFFELRTVREDFHWLHDEFLRYGLEQVSDSIVNPKMLRGKEIERRFISKSELASRLGVSRATLRKWNDKGLIAMKRIDGPAGPQYVADCEAVKPPLAKDKSKVLEAGEAAALLKIPVNVLRRLKADGHFPSHYRIRFKCGYHPADVDTFLTRLLALSPCVTPTELDIQSTVSLSYALARYPMHDPEHKIKFVVAYLSGEFRSVGRTGNTTEDILFRKEDIAALAAAGRICAAGGALTQKGAAQMIECDPKAIPALMAHGYLEPTTTPKSTRISRISVELFAQRYISLRKVANDLGTNSNRLMRLCDRSGISLLLILRPPCGVVPFIQRGQLDELLAIANQQPGQKQASVAKAQMEHPAITALRSYLAGLRERGEPLPRRAGQPNKKAIAQACGFSRDVLYDNAEAITVLNVFADNEPTGAGTPFHAGATD